MRRTSPLAERVLVLLVATVEIASMQTAMPSNEPARPEWVLVLHGGAGNIPVDTPKELVRDYQEGLSEAMEVGTRMLAAGKPAIDVVGEVVVNLEDNPIFNAGKGAVFTAAGTHELDACLMDGTTMKSGAVAGVQRVKNPIRAARRVMDDTRHILLAGEGADQFAHAAGCEMVEPSYFFTNRRFAGLSRYLAEHDVAPLEAPAYKLPPGVAIEAEVSGEAGDRPGNTVGCVALDTRGHLAAATSTGGLTGKLLGRVGDTPIVGAGTYANGHCGVSGTGVGEQFMRHTIAARVAWLVESGQTPREAVRHCLTEILKPKDGGLIAISANGQVTAQTTTGAMPHAIANSVGRQEVGIWVEGPEGDTEAE